MCTCIHNVSLHVHLSLFLHQRKEHLLTSDLSGSGIFFLFRPATVHVLSDKLEQGDGLSVVRTVLELFICAATKTRTDKSINVFFPYFNLCLIALHDFKISYYYITSVIT